MIIISIIGLLFMAAIVVLLFAIWRALIAANGIAYNKVKVDNKPITGIENAIKKFADSIGHLNTSIRNFSNKVDNGD